jgi:hypothetical protein
VKSVITHARLVANAVTNAIRRTVEPALEDDAKPLDIRHAIIEDIERQVQPAGKGRRVLPARGLGVAILTRSPEDHVALTAVLADLQGDITARLREIRCDIPARFRVDVTYIQHRPDSWLPGRRFMVTFSEPLGAGSPGEESASIPELTLTIIRGHASQDSYSFAASVVRVGRSEAPVDDRGRVRRNHVAFGDDADRHNATVTRGHCEIRFLAEFGEYRLFDEGSANGTRIVRRGEALEVPPRDPVGSAIASGDELQFGTAAVRVHIGNRGSGTEA